MCYRRQPGDNLAEVAVVRPGPVRGILIEAQAGLRHEHGMLYAAAALIGLVSGITSGIFGVGGGIVMVPAMTLWLRQDIKTAIGTSLAVIVPAACMGAFKHWQFGHVHWKFALAMIPLALAGGYAGAWLAKATPSTILTRLFGGFLVMVGGYLLVRRS